MDKLRIKKLAEDFELIAHGYAFDSNVEKLLNSLNDIISDAKSGLILSVMDHVPGERFFQEGDLSKYPDLEISYSRFKLALMTEDKQYADIKAWAQKRKHQLFGKQ